jgi:hypothetical protein
LEIAESFRDRTRGLLGRDGLEGALMLRPARSVHTLRMRFPIDVIYCNREMVVLRTATMRPNRVGLPVLKARAIIEAEAGSAERWGVRPGDTLDLKGD